MVFPKTPRSRWTIAGLAACLYLAAPFVDYVFLSTQLYRGVYPVNADSIGIASHEFASALLYLAPFYLILLVSAVRNYRGGRNLWTLDPSRLLRSIVWTLACGTLVAHNIWEAGRYALLRMPLSVTQALLWAYLLLCIRASLAGRDDLEASRCD